MVTQNTKQKIPIFRMAECYIERTSGWEQCAAQAKGTYR